MNIEIDFDKRINVSDPGTIIETFSSKWEECFILTRNENEFIQVLREENGFFHLEYKSENVLKEASTRLDFHSVLSALIVFYHNNPKIKEIVSWKDVEQKPWWKFW